MRVLQEMRHIDDSMSTYKPTSEVSQVNDKAADGPMHISKELFDLLIKAKEYSVITDGAFDITYASVGYMYDFRKHVRPDEAQIAKALPAVNYLHVILDPKNQTVQFSQKGVRIDLGGIAKGYSVDRGIDVLKSFGFTRAYVGAGGDSRIMGDRFGEPWVVGIRDPMKGEGERDRANSAGGCGDFNLGGLRAVLRGKRCALSPHHRSAYRPFGEQSTQRHGHRAVRYAHRWTVEDGIRSWVRTRRWKSTTGLTTSMRSSSSSTARWSIPKACNAPGSGMPSNRPKRKFT